MENRDWLGTLLDVLYPPKPRCIICNRQLAAGGQRLCRDCKQAIVYDGPACLACGRPLTATNRPCPACDGAGYHFTRVYVLGLYEGLLKELIYRFKFGKQMRYGELLAQLFFEKLDQRGFPKADVLIPVPIHLDRLAERGFNQAAVLAHALGQRLRLPVAEDVLERVKSTLPQRELNRSQRMLNLAHAFTLRKAVAGKTVYIVDDILTTGATADTCAQVLRAGGAEAVYVLVLAAGTGR